MRIRGARPLIVLVIVLITASATAAGATAASVTAASVTAAGAAVSPGWRLSLTVHPPARDSVIMTSVSAPADDDVWAVGSVQPSSGGKAGRPVLEHWNGRGWLAVAMPGAVVSFQETFQVTALSASDVWVFSSADEPHDSAQWAHWNGRSWAVGTLPAPAVNAPGAAIDVTAAVAAGPDDIWAGGYVFAQAVPANGDWSVPFLVNWNGHAWRVYSSPHWMDTTGLSALGPADIWAAGSGNGDGNQGNVLLHWDGSSWRQIPVPEDLLGAQQTAYYDSDFTGVVAESPRSAWVVGEVPLPGNQAGFQGSGDGAGAAYWDGSRWTVAAIGALYPQWASPYLLTSAVSDGSGGLWAVSEVPGGDSPPTGLWHYAHARWTRVPLPGLAQDLVSSMAAGPGTGAAWIAAYSQQSGAAPGQIFSYGG
jgi:hypothetical protein